METPICSSPASADQANIGMAKFQTAPATSPKRRWLMNQLADL